MRAEEMNTSSINSTTLARLAQLMASVALASSLVACGGDSGGDSVASATPTPAPSPSATPAPSPTPTPSPAPTPVASAPAVTSVSDFFSNVLPNASSIVISAWVLSTDLDTALKAASAKGASITVITPYSQHTSNDPDVADILAAGANARAVFEYTSSAGTATSTITYKQALMDIHAKLAIVDGNVYMDGHNWFTTDIVVKDTYAADIAAVQTVLNDIVAGTATTLASAPNGDTATLFSTDKQVSLKNESDFLQNVAIPYLAAGTADEYDFIVESYNVNAASGNYNDNIGIGMCQISQLSTKPKMHLVLEQESGYNTNTRTLLQNLMFSDANADVRTNNNGHEKISMIRKAGVPIAAWFGSSNATTTDLFDWGMVTYDPTLLAALAGYFDTTEFANSTAITGTGVASTCGTVHS
jgi:hypothetical protein